MQTALTYLLYVAAAALLFVLAYGIINLARTDEKRASRSNILMRWRIAIQAICILILVALGLVSGVINLG